MTIPRRACPLLMTLLMAVGCSGESSTSREGAAADTTPGAAWEETVAEAGEADASSGAPHGKEHGDVTHKNRLANETSPYLLQHADNPVDWYPWGDEAIARARAEDKPLLVSIGYSACHWCHVMEHESFENEEIAALMNDLFVCIKVDREERPDIDEIYMTAVQMMSGQGGWPLNVFLTPELKPFFGGTYFPADPKYGRSSWPQVLKSVAEAYRMQRDKVEGLAAQITEHLASLSARPGGGDDQLLGPAVVDRALEAIASSFDPAYGGFGGAPKFPRTMDLSLLLRAYAKSKNVEHLRMISTSLDSMAAGGMYDQLGGGFHRYSTDERWLVPHFEKMLYDTALLSRLYAEAYQLTGEQNYARIARETLDWVGREMTSPAGGFYSAYDADSEGEEGRFYVWTYDEVIDVLGEEDGKLFSRMYDVDEGGNWEGKSIPHMVKSFQQVAELAGTDVESFMERWRGWKDELLERRSKRVRPGLDDKVLTDWNGLMISAAARAGRILGEPRYVAMAEKAARFILEDMKRGDDLLHSHRDGTSAIEAMLDDHAFLAAALLDLWEATFDPRWVDEAKRLQRRQDELFWDDAGGYFAARRSDDLIVRLKSGNDGALPNGNAVAVQNLMRLARLTGEAGYEERASAVLRHFMPSVEQSPRAYAQLLIGLDFTISPSREVVFVGDPDSKAMQSLVAVAWERFMPHAIMAGVPVDGSGTASGPMRASPLVEGRSLVDGKPAVYVCENYACKVPVTTEEALRAALNGR